MKTVFQEIAQWASELPYWEQVTLDKILAGKLLEDADYEELLQYLLEERTSERHPLHFRQGLDADHSGGRQSILLKEILELENVNALVPDQRLTFDNQLTAIFGRNGSGKSGYARVLGSAGFTRGDQEVLPDVTKPLDENQPVKATVKVNVDGTQKTISYEVGSPCPELSSFYVFDSTSVQVHMTGKNTFSFSPAGLSVLTELSKVTDGVRSRLKARIERLEKPGDFEKFFSGESVIRELMENLGAKTDIKKLKSLAEISEQDEKRIHELEVEIGNIGLGQHEEEVKKRKQDLGTLWKLHTWLVEAQKRLSSQVIVDINKQIRQYQELKNRVRELSVERFQHKRFTQTGTELWNNFIQTAHQLARAESQNGKLYPQEKDLCLLCQQPLSRDARQLILQLWEYLAGEVRSNLQEIEDEIDRRHKAIETEDGFSLSEDLAVSIALLAKIQPELGKRAECLVKVYMQLGRNVLGAMTSREVIGIKGDVPKDCSQDIRAIIQQLEADISKLEKRDLATRSEKLESERRVLEHRKKLGELLPTIKKYINQRIWARNASKAGGSTRHITQKYNSLFDQLVKKRYISIFEQTISSLGRPLQVEIATSGRKGKTVKQIQLKAHQTAESIADPEKVLSEGEKRAVALADFLTEAVLDEASSGIILDDPVTSLDLEWQKAIAEILVEEARNRQVIVFTHDMTFLYLLLKYAESEKLHKEVHWIKRGDVDDRPGYVYINNCPALEQSYKSSQPAREFYAQAQKKTTAEEQVALIRTGMAALRTSYEALVVYELFGGVVLRFDERISIGRLPSLVWNEDILKEIDANYGRLSCYIEGHLHSDALAEPLVPNMLRDEFETFDDLKNRIKDLKKAKKG